jgi:mycothione reductase
VPHYDLVIIGSGSGNSLVTPDFDDQKVAVIESGTFGGTCLNVGCIPTKMFVYAADVATTVREAGRYGVDAAFERARWKDVRDRVFGRIDPIAGKGLEYRRKMENTTPYLGRARFSGPKQLDVLGADGAVDTVSGDEIVIATGAAATIPDVVKESGVPFETSDTIMRLDDLPDRLLILGGGFISSEFAHVFSAFGTEVVIVTRGPALLRHLDEEVSSAFTHTAREHWEVHTSVEVDHLHRHGDGVRLGLTDGSHVEGDLLLVATGRHPQTADLDLEVAGVQTHDDGRVRVDEYGRTSVDGVWALGDASSPYMLKHVANHEARVIAHNLAHPDELVTFRHDHVPSAVFTHPQIAMVGLTEVEARESGRRVVSFSQKYGDTAYGWAMEDTTSFCKLVADEDTGEILGCHIFGAHASTLIQPIIQAMSLGQGCHDLARGQYWIHPALSEVIENAVLGLGLEVEDEPTVTPPGA